MIERKIQELIKKAIVEQQQAGRWPHFEVPAIAIESPQLAEHGDYACNISFPLSGLLKISPMEIGTVLLSGIRAMVQENKMISQVELAAPGFLNFSLAPAWLNGAVDTINQKGAEFGKSNAGRQKKVQVEFVSANPTGPIHVGNGRGAFLGDTLANILYWVGYRVEREYYINDLGKQIEILGESVTRRYLQNQGIHVPYPDYCYQGEYINEIAKSLHLKNYTLKNAQKINEIKNKIKQTVLKKMVREIQNLLTNKLRVKYDVWFSEQSLYDSGQFERTLNKLKEKDLTYEKEDALWFKSSGFGDDKDRVLIKNDGAPTYFASDIAHHEVNFLTNSKKINILGADHHGDVPRLQAAMSALGYQGKLDIILVQFVRLVEGGFEVKMSKRGGSFITLEELVDEIGLDVARFFFLMYSTATHMDFDLSLARKKSEKNPVFYVQYAHARICSIMKKLKIKKGQAKPKSNETELNHPAELALAKELIKFPDLLLKISQNYEIHRLPFYAVEIAKKFHNFYTQCRVIDQGEVNQARLELIQATQVVLKNVLSLMGVTAPKKM
ncbi:MAG: arginine--tRNA ligase [Candidatus Kerfeldbacteria bacterium CG_4_10_14_0_8_um_filter_42_10]|uniref:Arginine--tRNA ligase n=1 Tax=Candidatus Kerfeldbacteria bacterium CG_4_10_14_0_8_um_filter_42_10 TaxID=2014248 RepID=A0A2M7RHP9_9BACT|nr:MAG: arginine--tRNA ligase [Candidatus Kerfeldbacteria bacterium CG_4_10_14_0_8_um_filter_42_10]